ncbi:hypothetical protein BYT27DRAFT_7226594 [Phlegmacium glaucopus]|nr:hypothetical protein BYT27DRAFT_7226594 [Phlegmacium glaucopus]
MHEPLPNDTPPAPDFKSEANSYSVYRIYHGGRPSYTPDETFHLDYASDSCNFALKGPKITITPRQNPFSNTSILRLMNWFHNNATSKTLNDLDTLVHEVILAPDFDINHFIGFRGSRESECLDNFCEEPESPFSGDNSWIETSLNISVPCEKVPHTSESNAPIFKVEGLFYRRPLEVIKAAYCEATAEQFHTTPYKEYWQPSPGSPQERIYSELYNSDAYIQEHERIKAQPHMPGPQLETVIAAIMLSSDSTQLTSFGTASLWPIYLYLGNLSKFSRLKPTSFAAHHLAYIPKLGDTIQDFYRATYGKAASSEMLTHLRRELMQAIWLLLLDDDFMEAYIHGIVLEFADGIMRRLYPRIFTYAADYPEKILLACIKYLGSFPCPRCLVPNHQISELGTKNDQKRREKLARIDNEHRRDTVELARKWIYEKGINVKSKSIKDLLGPKGWTPTRNAFSEKLSPLGFDFHSMFIPDLLHEFELGVWKATFAHLIRILYAQGGDAIAYLNLRYRQVPSFGRDTIRKFNNNASGMKKLAARDYEDLLQCAIPVFEGLLPEPHNKIVHGLLFELVTWHALAKLRLHTKSTVTALETSTTRLGIALRKFASTTCEAYETRDLPSEESARGRQKAALSTKKKGLQKHASAKKTTAGPRKRMFNLSCYKPHSLPDYAKSIRMYGTTDNYSTQPGELEHRRVKRQYPRAHKGKFAVGIAKQTRRERILHNIMKRHSHLKVSRKRKHGVPHEPPIISSTTCGNPSIPFSASEPLPAAPSNQHYQMSMEIRHKVPISVWLGDNKGDPALKDFLPRLQDHLLGRILGHDFTGDEETFTAAERSKISFANGHLYRHKVLRVNYTSYDLRRCQDSLNPRTHPDIMVLSHEDDDSHPYWYAKIIGIFHAIVQHPSKPDPVSMDFLWVRWYGRNMTHKSGWRSKHLPRIGFVDSDDALPFGFLDPLHVVRGCHLIPAFHHGRTEDLLPPSIARLEIENDEDWLYYYVNIYGVNTDCVSFRFVDRDMMMRYRGGGVGHKSTRDATNKFLTDRDRLDIPTTTNDDTNSDSESDKSVEDVQEEVEAIEEEGGEDVSVGDEEKEPDPNEDSDSEDDDDAKFEEEFDYGLGEDGSNDEDGDEEADEADGDALGPEDGDEEDDDDFGYADL